jgi:type II secretory pathway pseudopilin PulG
MVELVIVLVIIAIIAAIAVPRLASSATGSSERALAANLNALRRAIDAYAAEHVRAFPAVNEDGAGGSQNSPEAFVSQLTAYSDVHGKTSATKTGEFILGPYLRAIPELPVGGNRGHTEVLIDASNSPPLVQATAAGWVYNPTTGEIIANSDDANAAGTRTYDQY